MYVGTYYFVSVYASVRSTWLESARVLKPILAGHVRLLQGLRLTSGEGAGPACSTSTEIASSGNTPLQVQCMPHRTLSYSTAGRMTH